MGAEWTILAQGDLDGSGVERVIAYRRSSVEPAQVNLPPAYARYDLILEQLVLVQRNLVGQPWVRVLVTPDGVFLDEDSKPMLVPGGPTAATRGFALHLEPITNAPRLVPLDDQGQPTNHGFVIWPSVDGSRYEFVALNPAGPQPVWPGPAWQVIHEGDFNADGLVERIYLRPANLRPGPAFAQGSDRNYQWMAEELMIVQVEAGQLRRLFILTRNEMRADQRLLADFSAARPGSFLIAVGLDAQTPLSVLALNQHGESTSQGFEVGWDAMTASYQLIFK